VEKASQGIWPSYAPIGYLNADGANGKRTIVPDPVRAPLVRRLYELCATGQHSVKELAAIAQSELLTRGSPIQKSTVNKILRNRVYSGEFEWRGEKYTAAYDPIVPRDLWLAAQAALGRRLGTRAKKTGHCFPFSGMLTCGSCGFAMVGEIKGKYVYYHCSGARGKCGQPYVRQETLEEAYAAMLRRISIDEDIVNWIATALRESHGDQKRFRDESVARLQQEHTRLQNRLDVLYEDRLDGRIDLSLFERKSSEYRQEQARIQAEINGFGTADGQYNGRGHPAARTHAKHAQVVRKAASRRKTPVARFRRVEPGLEGRQDSSGPASTIRHDCACERVGSSGNWRRTDRNRRKSKLAPRHGFEPHY
jgi:hypothetical protein